MKMPVGYPQHGFEERMLNMTRFIPREKLGRKARREMDAKQRQTWTVSPVTKTVESRKKYNRIRESRNLRKEWSCGTFLYAA